jgi:hypothetical protein
MEQDCTLTMSVPEAGKKYFGLGRNASYAAAARGEIPTIKIGSRIFAVVAGLDRMIERAGLTESGFTESNSTSRPKKDNTAVNARSERS